ncbi:MAG: Lrp/AsnC family transcriptional regulator [Candidatus Diapherotrites archaeon]|nr:Lrp/AsnC family transcriptional regulator [Candidatus Diapherotrites archaeon]
MAELFKLDKIDKKILYELDLYSRVTNSRIAKKAGTSEQVVTYRIRRLQKSGVVRKFYAVINTAKFDFENFRLYLRFQNLSIEKETELVNYLVENPFTMWIARCRGHWDMVVSFTARNIKHFGEIFKEMLSRFDNVILNKNICTVEKVDHFTRAYLIEEPVLKLAYTYAGSKELLKIDDLDRNILSSLSENSRESSLEFSKKFSSSPDTIIKRIKKLEQSKAILGYGALLNLKRIGYFNNIIIVKLHYLNLKRLKEFFDFTHEHKNIIFAAHLLGDHDIDLEVEVSSREELDNLISKLREKFTDIIRDFELLTVYDEPKWDFYPKGARK